MSLWQRTKSLFRRESTSMTRRAEYMALALIGLCKFVRSRGFCDCYVVQLSNGRARLYPEPQTMPHEYFDYDLPEVKDEFHLFREAVEHDLDHLIAERGDP